MPDFTSSPAYLTRKFAWARSVQGSIRKIIELIVSQSQNLRGLPKTDIFKWNPLLDWGSGAPVVHFFVWTPALELTEFHFWPIDPCGALS